MKKLPNPIFFTSHIPQLPTPVFPTPQTGKTPNLNCSKTLLAPNNIDHLSIHHGSSVNIAISLPRGCCSFVPGTNPNRFPSSELLPTSYFLRCHNILPHKRRRSKQARIFSIIIPVDTSTLSALKLSFINTN